LSATRQQLSKWLTIWLSVCNGPLVQQSMVFAIVEFVCHTRDSCIHDSRYWNKLHTIW